MRFPPGVGQCTNRVVIFPVHLPGIDRPAGKPTHVGEQVVILHVPAEAGSGSGSTDSRRVFCHKPTDVIHFDDRLRGLSEIVVAPGLSFIVYKQGCQVVLLAVGLEGGKDGVVCLQLTDKLVIRITETFVKAETFVYRLVQIPPGVTEQIRVDVVPCIKPFVDTFQHSLFYPLRQIKPGHRLRSIAFRIQPVYQPGEP